MITEHKTTEGCSIKRILIIDDDCGLEAVIKADGGLFIAAVDYFSVEVWRELPNTVTETLMYMVALRDEFLRVFQIISKELLLSNKSVIDLLETLKGIMSKGEIYTFSKKHDGIRVNPLLAAASLKVKAKKRKEKT